MPIEAVTISKIREINVSFGFPWRNISECNYLPNIHNENV